MKSVIILTGAFMAQLAAGAISNVCTDIKISFTDSSSPVYLTANCKIRGKGAQCSQLDLNQCLALELGSSASSPSTIYGQGGGNFGHYCTGCGATTSSIPTTKYCTCEAYANNDGPVYGETEVDLNAGTLIQDSNGFLTCYGHTASAHDNC